MYILLYHMALVAYLGNSSIGCCFRFGRPNLLQRIDESELNKRPEQIDETHTHPNVKCFGIAYTWQCE